MIKNLTLSLADISIKRPRTVLRAIALLMVLLLIVPVVLGVAPSWLLRMTPLTIDTDPEMAWLAHG